MVFLPRRNLSVNIYHLSDEDPNGDGALRSFRTSQRRCTRTAPENPCRSCGLSYSILGVPDDHLRWSVFSFYVANSLDRIVLTSEVRALGYR